MVLEAYQDEAANEAQRMRSEELSSHYYLPDDHLKLDGLSDEDKKMAVVWINPEGSEASADSLTETLPSKFTNRPCLLVSHNVIGIQIPYDEL
jgi:hypothetical protein